MVFRSRTRGFYRIFPLGWQHPAYLRADIERVTHRVISYPDAGRSLLADDRPSTPFDESSARIFQNPILPAPAQDPQAVWHEGLYYYCESSNAGISVRSVRSFVDLRAAPPRCVWTPPKLGPASRNLWAPELHRIDGRFYIYFAADDGRNENHRTWVLAADTEDPAGLYHLAGMLETGGWAIDGTVMHTGDGNRYFIWSGWPGARNGRQNLYAARMNSPLELAGARVLLASPDQAWERRGMPICEGPQVLQRDGRTFLIYSASGSWTENYCLGLLVHEGGDVLDPRAWRKLGPVFQKNQHARGVGHCGFVKSPDGREDWILYHAKTSRRIGWSDREVRAQRFAWSATGLPVFGEPVDRALAQPRPSIDAAGFARSA